MSQVHVQFFLTQSVTALRALARIGIIDQGMLQLVASKEVARLEMKDIDEARRRFHGVPSNVEIRPLIRVWSLTPVCALVPAPARPAIVAIVVRLQQLTETNQYRLIYAHLGTYHFGWKCLMGEQFSWLKFETDYLST